MSVCDHAYVCVAGCVCECVRTCVLTRMCVRENACVCTCVHAHKDECHWTSQSLVQLSDLLASRGQEGSLVRVFAIPPGSVQRTGQGCQAPVLLCSYPSV